MLTVEMDPTLDVNQFMHSLGDYVVQLPGVETADIEHLGELEKLNEIDVKDMN